MSQLSRQEFYDLGTQVDGSQVPVTLVRQDSDEMGVDSDPDSIAPAPVAAPEPEPEQHSRPRQANQDLPIGARPRPRQAGSQSAQLEAKMEVLFKQMKILQDALEHIQHGVGEMSSKVWNIEERQGQTSTHDRQAVVRGLAKWASGQKPTVCIYGFLWYIKLYISMYIYIYMFLYIYI